MTIRVGRLRATREIRLIVPLNVQPLVRQRPLQPQCFFPSFQPFALLLGIDEDDGHGVLVDRSHHVIRFRGQKRKQLPITELPRAALLTRLLGEAFPTPRPPYAGEVRHFAAWHGEPCGIPHRLSEGCEV